VEIRKNEDLLGLPSIDVISASGEKLGVMPPADALRLARERGLDLFEVNPRAEPPVCKIVDVNKYKYEELKKAAQARRGPRGQAPLVFLVRNKMSLRGRPGTYLVGDIVTGDNVCAGMVAHVPGGPDVFHAVPILGVGFVDHIGGKTSELSLHVVGETPEQVSAVAELEGAHLIEITEG
jgi:hypothetical protein